MERKDSSFEFKSMSDTGLFEGYAAVYENVDYGGDRIKRGAFAAAIARQPGDGYPLLWGHDGNEPLGFSKLSDSKEGLVIRGEIDREDPAGERAYKRIKKRVVKGLSIGYSVPDDEGAISFASGVRNLHKVYLHEVSLTAMPMNPLAQITNVKSIGEAVSLITRLQSDVGSEYLAELRQLQKHLARIIPIERAAAPNPTSVAILGELRSWAKDVQGKAA